MTDPSTPLSLPPDSDPTAPQEPDAEPFPAATAPLPSASQPRTIREDDRLEAILSKLREKRWNIKDFLRSLERRKDQGRYRERTTWKKAFHGFQAYAYRDLPSRRTARDVLGKHPSPALKAWAFEIVGQELQAEVKALVTHEAFGSWTPSTLHDNDELTFNQTSELIAERAPGWLRLLKDATVDPDSGDADQIKQGDFLMTSMLCRRAHRRSSNKTAQALGIYLYHAGTKRRALDTLAGLGACVSYRSIMRQIQQMEELSVQEVRKMGQNSLSVPTYDNFEWQEGRRGERLGDARPGLRSITTALVIEDRLKLTTPFRTNMWQPERSLLRADEMALDHTREARAIGRQMRRYHIETAIRSVLTDEEDVHNIQWTTEAPVLERLPPVKTKCLPLRPIMKNESFTADNIQIMEEILYKQFGLKRDDAALLNGFRMFAGDLKTWDRMQSVKTIRQETSRIHRGDSFRWLIPTIGLWHLEYNLASLIHRSHWGKPRFADQSHLQFAADRWNRTQATDGKKYESVVELLVHSYQSRIVGALMAYLKSEKQMGIQSVADLRSWLGQQDKQSLQAVLDLIELKLDPTSVDDTFDDIYWNHQMFCSHMEAFMTLRYAIKHADIGILRFALKEATILMLSREAKTPRYAKALLYTWHLVASPASNKELQDSVLANSLVNLQGKEDTNFELDRLLELLNGKLKRFQKERTNGATDRSDNILQRWALVGPRLEGLQDSIEKSFGQANNGRHVPKKAHEDIFSMAHLLSTNSLEKPVQRYSMHVALDLFKLGVSRLAEAVYNYNEGYDPDICMDIEPVLGLYEDLRIPEIPEAALTSCNPVQDDEMELVHADVD